MASPNRFALTNPSSLALLSLCLFALGCSAVMPSTEPVAAPMLKGHLHGGQQPVSGAAVQLYAAGTTGYGTGAIALLAAPILSDANGNFTITNASPCPSATSQLYIVATGGNPGLPTPTDNTSLAEMAAIGPCILSGTEYISNPDSFINIDEVTTVAAVYALAGFMSPTATQIGASATNSTGIANAFQSAANIADTTSGQALITTPAGNGTVPQAEINTLADIISPCVNSTGTGSACTALFTAATPPSGTAPTNTIQALYNVATNPALQVAALFAISTATAPFQPTLSSAPNDWTLAVNYTGGLSNPDSMAIDASGNIWIANNGTSASTGSVTELSTTGAVLSGSTGFTGGGLSFPIGIGIDPSGNAWVAADGNNGAVVEFSSNGAVLSGTHGYTARAMDFPRAIAIDGRGDAWVPNFGGPIPASLVELGSNGAVLPGTTGFMAGSMNSPYAVAVDAFGNVWVANIDNENISEFNGSGSELSSTTGYTGGGLSGDPSTVAIDASGNAWIFDDFTANLTQLSSTGTVLSGSTGFPSCVPITTTPNLLCDPLGSHALAIDGTGDLWVPLSFSTNDPQTGIDMNYVGLAELNNSGTILSGSFGYNTNFTNYPAAIAIDGSGNVWSAAGTNVVTELIGAATPVVTPLSVGAKTNTLATRP